MPNGCGPNNGMKYCGHITLLLFKKEISFTIVYDANDILSIKIGTPTWFRAQFNEEKNDKGLRSAANLIDKTHDIADTREFSAKQRASRR